MFKTPLSLNAILIAVGSATTIGVMLLMTWNLVHVSSETLSNLIGENLTVLADQVHDKLERTVSERQQDLTSLAQRLDRISQDDTSTNKVLSEALETNHDLEWIALLSADGKALQIAGKAPPDMLSWVSSSISSGETEKAPQRLLNAKDARHLILAVPVYSASMNAGFVVAVLKSGWADKVKHELRNGIASHPGIELSILTPDGSSPSGIWSTAGAAKDNTLANATLKSKARWAHEPARGQGGDVIAAISESPNPSSKSMVEFRVLLQQPSALALRPLDSLRNTVIASLIFFALHAFAVHLLLSSTVAAPFHRLAHAADAVRTTGHGDIPSLKPFAEAKLLSDSLSALVSELKSREGKLIALGENLEMQVRQRTQELERQNTKLAEATAKAEQATKEKSRLLAVASHDLRQPLHALSLFSLALKRRLETQETLELAMQMEQSVGALVSMFDELLHVARLDAGLVARNLVPVYLPEFIERLGAEFAYEADQKSLRFNFYACRCHVLTDPALLEIVLRNLLSNAMKFTSSGGVVLAARSRGDRVVIEVYDTGPGIDARRVHSIFNEFERGLEHARGPNEGLGLGLAIVKKHAGLIDAELTLQSRLGRGTRFGIQMAKCHEPPVAASNTAMMPCTQSTQVAASNVLLLDDNYHLRRALSLDLGDRGLCVTGVATAREAQSALAAGSHFDVAVVDYDLGTNESGLDFVKSQWEKGRIFQALILTGRTDAPTLAKIQNSGVEYMTKPANSDALVAAIRRLHQARQLNTLALAV